jgi:hypothetical protein
MNFQIITLDKMILDKHTWGMLNMRPRPYKREYGKQTQYNLHSGVAVLVRPYEYIIGMAVMTSKVLPSNLVEGALVGRPSQQVFIAISLGSLILHCPFFYNGIL